MTGVCFVAVYIQIPTTRGAVNMKVRIPVIVDSDLWCDVKRRAMEQGVTLADYVEYCFRNGPRVVEPDDIKENETSES